MNIVQRKSPQYNIAEHYVNKPVADFFSALDAAGARFCRVRAGDKKPVGGAWQKRPYRFDQVRRWHERGENAGLIAGYGNYGFLDVDARFSDFCRQFPDLAGAPYIGRPNAPDKGKLLIRVVGAMPPPQKWRRTREEPPYLEWLSTGNQGVILGTHPSGAPYTLYNAGAPVPELTPAALHELLTRWTHDGAGLKQFTAPRAVAAPEPRIPTILPANSDELAEVERRVRLKIAPRLGKRGRKPGYYECPQEHGPDGKDFLFNVEPGAPIGGCQGKHAGVLTRWVDLAEYLNIDVSAIARDVARERRPPSPPPPRAWQPKPKAEARSYSMAEFLAAMRWPAARETATASDVKAVDPADPDAGATVNGLPTATAERLCSMKSHSLALALDTLYRAGWEVGRTFILADALAAGVRVREHTLRRALETFVCGEQVDGRGRPALLYQLPAPRAVHYRFFPHAPYKDRTTELPGEALESVALYRAHIQVAWLQEEEGQHTRAAMGERLGMSGSTAYRYQKMLCGHYLSRARYNEQRLTRTHARNLPTAATMYEGGKWITDHAGRPLAATRKNAEELLANGGGFFMQREANWYEITRPFRVLAVIAQKVVSVGRDVLLKLRAAGKELNRFLHGSGLKEAGDPVKSAFKSPPDRNQRILELLAAGAGAAT